MLKIKGICTSSCLLAGLLWGAAGPAAAAPVVAGEDGSITLPHVQVGGQWYRARLDLSAWASSRLLPTLELSAVEPAGADGQEDGFYVVGTRTLSIPNLEIDGVAYSVSFRRNAFDQFVLEQIHLREQLSLLYLITSGTASFHEQGQYGGLEVGPHFILPAASSVLLFSDRPYRIARSFQGGLPAFANFYGNSDFPDDPPNVTFSGRLTDAGSEVATVFEMSAPFTDQDRFVIPVTRVIGEESLPPPGSYGNVSLVVDHWWSSVTSAVAGAAGSVASDAASAVSAAAQDVEQGASDAWQAAHGTLVHGLHDIQGLMPHFSPDADMIREGNAAVTRHLGVLDALYGHSDDFVKLASPLLHRDVKQVWQGLRPILTDPAVASALDGLHTDLGDYSVVVDLQQSVEDVGGESGACGMAFSLALRDSFTDPSFLPAWSSYCSIGGSIGAQAGATLGLHVGLAFNTPAKQEGPFVGMKATAVTGAGTGIAMSWPAHLHFGLPKWPGTRLGRITMPLSAGVAVSVAATAGYRFIDHMGN